MRFKNLLLAMTMLAMPVVTYADNSIKWEKEAQDPATGGVQLVGSQHENVKEAYADTQQSAGGYTSTAERRKAFDPVAQALAAFKKWKDLAGKEYDLSKEIEGLKDELEKETDKLDKAEKALKDAEDKLKDTQEAKDWEEKKKKMDEACQNAAAADIGTYGFSQIDCSAPEKTSRIMLQNYPELRDAIEEYKYADARYRSLDNAEIYKARQEIDEVKPKVEKLKNELSDKEDKYNELKRENEKALDEYLDKEGDTANLGNKDIDNAQSIIEKYILDPTPENERAAQNTLNQLADVYGIDRMDLSTEEGQDKANALAYFLDEKKKRAQERESKSQ